MMIMENGETISLLHSHKRGYRMLSWGVEIIVVVTRNSIQFYGVFFSSARCLKITEKISFNIASEASYVYILSGQKLIKNAKNGPF